MYATNMCCVLHSTLIYLRFPLVSNRLLTHVALEEGDVRVIDPHPRKNLEMAES